MQFQEHKQSFLGQHCHFVPVFPSFFKRKCRPTSIQQRFGFGTISDKATYHSEWTQLQFGSRDHGCEDNIYLELKSCKGERLF